MEPEKEQMRDRVLGDLLTNQLIIKREKLSENLIILIVSII